MSLSCDIALFNPKYIHNLATIYRSCACWDIDKLYYSGDRISFDVERIPREFRIRDYKSTQLIHTNRFKDIISDNKYIPIAVELLDQSENMYNFQLPAITENGKILFIFGPEDGSLNRNILQHCHRFIHIPTKYSLNIATCVNSIISYFHPYL